jgi:hypothetical protein
MSRRCSTGWRNDHIWIQWIAKGITCKNDGNFDIVDSCVRCPELTAAAVLFSLLSVIGWLSVA